MRIVSEAPSNIALIKYMGKIDAQKNKPTNSSISFTLDHLRTRVVIEPISAQQDEWQPLSEEDFRGIELSEKGKARFLKHFGFLKDQLKIPGYYSISSANNFPSDCGLASSASSFAALTRAAVALAKEVSLEKEEAEALSLREQAELSRQGSGSSCRSFLSPFALWTERGVESVSVPRASWHHSVIVVEAGKKEISSSEAHVRVSESLLFQGRPERAEVRLKSLIEALSLQAWSDIFEICWAEFWDMHALFETSQPSFGYMQPESLSVLKYIREYWQNNQDGPVVTMDAGANVHLLYREDQKEMAKFLAKEFSKSYSVHSSFGALA